MDAVCRQGIKYQPAANSEGMRACSNASSYQPLLFPSHSLVLCIFLSVPSFALIFALVAKEKPRGRSRSRKLLSPSVSN